jgi:Ca2+-binding EF-hand superfamily protein
LQDEKEKATDGARADKHRVDNDDNSNSSKSDAVVCSTNKHRNSSLRLSLNGEAAARSSFFDVDDSVLRGYSSSGACLAKTQDVFGRHAKAKGGAKRNLGEMGFLQALETFQSEWDKTISGSLDLTAARHLFQLFRTKSGVSLESFIRCVKVIVFGSHEQKFRLAFDIYDFDRSGSFGIENILRVMTSLDEADSGNMWDVTLFSEQVLHCFNVGSGDCVDFERYKTACMQNPVLLDCCSHGIFGGMSKTDSKTKSTSTSSRPGKFRFNWQSMKTLWTQMRQKGDQGFHQYECVDLKGFLTVMSGFFNPHSQLDKRLVERLFKVFDVDGNHNISLQEFIQGMSKIFHGTEEQRARFYFNLFDLNGDGTITRSELSYIMSRRYEVGGYGGNLESTQKVVTALNNIDEDGNGEIDEGELVKAVALDPSTLDAFESAVFGESYTRFTANLRGKKVKS